MKKFIKQDNKLCPNCGQYKMQKYRTSLLGIAAILGIISGASIVFIITLPLLIVTLPALVACLIAAIFVKGAVCQNCAYKLGHPLPDKE